MSDLQVLDLLFLVRAMEEDQNLETLVPALVNADQFDVAGLQLALFFYQNDRLDASSIKKSSNLQQLMRKSGAPASTCDALFQEALA